jgi:hypothetical protein
MSRRIMSEDSSDRAIPILFFVGGALVLLAMIGGPIFYYGFCMFDVPNVSHRRAHAQDGQGSAERRGARA